ncbi:ST3 beta-galactoside alpha-2,3-sialyltransferase 7 isoform X2 [Dunckerocampus dactyliophorus]|uniref:ST3 beta-galactoside alpha-2,3-sialyltransferase 7 isoform X2 n=1 Tax=Dunckerocampus dactyliophorus TaxID=161453 RepID=UPI0024074622|nr:ST3 beta-galactoside alpha-2,3-sialyltransferase 7 isoform X2 [Dunckerocampus dactyliophorus]
MVILNRLSVEDDPHDGSTLLPEAAEAAVTMPAAHKQATQSHSKNFFLSRSENRVISVVLLVACYSAILLPAYFPLHKQSMNDDQYPKDLVWTHLYLASLTFTHFYSSPFYLSFFCPLQDLLNRSASLLARPYGSGACWDMPPPLGLRGSKEHLEQALAAVPQPGLPPSLTRSEGRCRRCVVVGSGGVLRGSHLGSHIDQYDVIIRMNNAPVLGYERDAGSHTTIRLMYPEGAPSSANDYNKTNIVALVVFKSLDLDWLTSVITKQPLSFWSKLWFWKEVVDDIPLRPENFRILHPEIIRKTGEVLQKYSQKQGNMVPTLGAGAVVMALQLCDHVSLAGFGYDMQHPHAPLHYYETIQMAAMQAQVVHDVSAEKLFLRELVAAGAVTDLTGAL